MQQSSNLGGSGVPFSTSNAFHKRSVSLQPNSPFVQSNQGGMHFPSNSFDENRFIQVAPIQKKKKFCNSKGRSSGLGHADTGVTKSPSGKSGGESPVSAGLEK